MVEEPTATVIGFWTGAAATDRELGLWLLAALVAAVLVGVGLAWLTDQVHAWWRRRRRACT